MSDNIFENHLQNFFFENYIEFLSQNLSNGILAHIHLEPENLIEEDNILPPGYLPNRFEGDADALVIIPEDDVLEVIPDDNVLEVIPEDMPENVPENMLEDVADMLEIMPENPPEHAPDQPPQNVEIEDNVNTQHDRYGVVIQHIVDSFLSGRRSIPPQVQAAFEHKSNVLQKLIKFQATTVDSDDKCTICFAEYIEQQLLCKLPCNHMFHYDCINTWFNQKCICPLCRAPVLP